MGMKKRNYKRGDIFYVTRINSSGSEQRAGRPAIIVSNDINNAYSRVVEMVFLTTKKKRRIPTHVTIRSTGIPSVALCEQPVPVDVSRLGNYICSCSKWEMIFVDIALMISVGILKNYNMKGKRKMVNNSIIMGRLTADPELRQTANGINTCSFTVAVDRNYVSQGQDRQTDFIPVVAWRHTAEFVSRNFSKGKMIAVVGQLRTRSYDDKRYPDVKHYVMEMYADSVSFCGDKPATNPEKSSGNDIPDNVPEYAHVPSGNYGDFEEIIGDSDLPF